MDKPYGWCADKLCLSPKLRDPWETDYAAIVPRFSGGASAISSALIMYIILKSETRLSTIYHRIMFGMSLADISGSVSIALTSLPMPSSMPEELAMGYDWAGTRLGNTYTCNAQGFFQTLGIITMYAYNGMLCVYYACAIAFAMQEKKIKKYVEPLLHGFPLTLGLGLSIPPLFFELYNPDITAFPSCQIIPYPGSCMTGVVDCIRGDAQVMAKMLPVLYFIIPLDLVIILVSMFLVVRSVIRTDRLIKTVTVMLALHHGGAGADTAVNMQQEVERQRRTKASLLQAVSYILAFTLTLLFPLLRLTLYFTNFKSTQDEDDTRFELFDKLTLVFLPLQGFFNFIIFISFKVYNHRRLRGDMSICQILIMLFTKSVHDPTLISGISMVKQNESNVDDDDDAEEGSAAELQQQQQQQQFTRLTDLEGHESNYELQFRLNYLLQVTQSENQDVLQNLGRSAGAVLAGGASARKNNRNKKNLMLLDESDLTDEHHPKNYKNSSLFSFSSGDISTISPDGNERVDNMIDNAGGSKDSYHHGKTGGGGAHSLLSFSSKEGLSHDDKRVSFDEESNAANHRRDDKSCKNSLLSFSSGGGFSTSINTVDGFGDDEMNASNPKQKRNQKNSLLSVSTDGGGAFSSSIESSYDTRNSSVHEKSSLFSFSSKGVLGMFFARGSSTSNSAGSVKKGHNAEDGNHSNQHPTEDPKGVQTSLYSFSSRGACSNRSTDSGKNDEDFQNHSTNISREEDHATYGFNNSLYSFSSRGAVSNVSGNSNSAAGMSTNQQYSAGTGNDDPTRSNNVLQSFSSMGACSNISSFNNSNNMRLGTGAPEDDNNYSTNTSRDQTSTNKSTYSYCSMGACSNFSTNDDTGPDNDSTKHYDVEL